MLTIHRQPMPTIRTFIADANHMITTNADHTHTTDADHTYTPMLTIPISHKTDANHTYAADILISMDIQSETADEKIFNIIIHFLSL